MYPKQEMTEEKKPQSNLVHELQTYSTLPADYIDWSGKNKQSFFRKSLGKLYDLSD